MIAMDRYIISIDQSTSASKAFLLDAQGNIVKRFSKNHQQFYPKAGYVEHDAEEIWQNVLEGISDVSQGLLASQIAAISISNQRETTVLWDRKSGKPVCKAVVWQDVRGAELCEQLLAHAEMVQAKTGLALSPYYPAAKAASVLQADSELMAKAQDGSLCIGTVDSYLVYRLTDGSVFQTDVSNASRTELINLSTLSWDGELLDLFGIPECCLAKIVMSDGDFGQTACDGIPVGIPITGVMGDSHAALFGQGCLSAGMAKATYGTGSSVMMNIGKDVVQSQNGLSASVGFGFAGEICYVLEGNVTCSGDTLCWLRDEAEMVEDVKLVETIAASVDSSEGVYFVPAFSGLGAPYFDGRARALLCGMNRATTKAHIVRAALESMAYQDADVIEAMQKDTGIKLSELRVDGGPTHNALLMQFQADLLDCKVQCAAQSELSALGVGYMAGIKCGIFKDMDSIPARRQLGKTYQPRMDATARIAAQEGWLAAIQRCL